MMCSTLRTAHLAVRRILDILHTSILTHIDSLFGDRAEAPVRVEAPLTQSRVTTREERHSYRVRETQHDGVEDPADTHRRNHTASREKWRVLLPKLH
ncbi:hypothetical protein Q8A67_018223 [Cirrhinus molitorella]|uniref:Uncharacterized protein n=1 Tax=Cirrhinus molitorella TaxID=172907 RepID=A0AA88PBN8_9TELE|nr:hypothetical protein Q8A67_018223 [Cirrhinus molitorella]